jgi:hypothetical protein
LTSASLVDTILWAELDALLVGGDPPESGKIDPGSFFPG